MCCHVLLLKPFYAYLGTEEEIVKYIALCELDFSKENFAKTCLNALRAIHDKKFPEATFKKATKFASNFLVQSASNENRNKTPYDTLKENFIKNGSIEETRKFINFLEKRKIESIESFNAEFEAFKGEDGSTTSAIALFKKLSDKMTLENFSKSLKDLKHAIEKFTKETGVTSPSLQNIDYKLLTEEDLELDFNNKDMLCKIIKKLTHGKDYRSVLTSFINCYTNTEKMSIMKSGIAKELTRVEKEGFEPYDNLKKVLKLRKEDLGLAENATSEEYGRAIYENIPQKFMDFINSDIFTRKFKNVTKIPKISIHAKLRLIDRFLLNEGKGLSYLYSKAAKEEIQAVLRAVYDIDPKEIKLISAENMAGRNYRIAKDDAYKILFTYNSEPCHAVFCSKTGLMETIFYRD